MDIEWFFWFEKYYVQKLYYVKKYIFNKLATLGLDIILKGNVISIFIFSNKFFLHLALLALQCMLWPLLWLIFSLPFLPSTKSSNYLSNFISVLPSHSLSSSLWWHPTFLEATPVELCHKNVLASLDFDLVWQPNVGGFCVSLTTGLLVWMYFFKGWRTCLQCKMFKKSRLIIAVS